LDWAVLYEGGIGIGEDKYRGLEQDSRGLVEESKAGEEDEGSWAVLDGEKESKNGID
jgi:hypothetical protein